MKDFHKLKVWQKAHELTLVVYQISSTFPKEGLYGLTSQIRRSAMSVPTNIAEGCGRNGDADFGRFLQIAMGSTAELEYQLLLARDLKMLKTPEFEALNTHLGEIKGMLISLIKKVKSG
jgi:four helix bundle protein